MKYLVLDIAQIDHGEPIKVIATITDDDITKLKENGDCNDNQPELPLVRIDLEGNTIAIPLDADYSNLPNYMTLLTEQD